MAFPDYSIVHYERPDPVTPANTIVERPLIFTRVTEARTFYNYCVSQNWRCWLFEKPQPNLFHRNDSITVVPYVNQD